MSSLPTGCSAVQWAMWKGGTLPPVTVQRIICCQASYWPCNHKLSSYWSGSLSLRIIVLSQFPTPVPVKLNDGQIYHPQKPKYHFKKGWHQVRKPYKVGTKCFVDTFCGHFCEDIYFLTCFTNTFFDTFCGNCLQKFFS